MRDVIPKLKAAGATGIVEYPLSKVVVVSRCSCEWFAMKLVKTFGRGEGSSER